MGMCSQVEASGTLLNGRIRYASDRRLDGHRVDLDVVEVRLTGIEPRSSKL
jgi:hypothetical protein